MTEPLVHSWAGNKTLMFADGFNFTLEGIKRWKGFPELSYLRGVSNAVRKTSDRVSQTKIAGVI